MTRTRRPHPLRLLLLFLLLAGPAACAPAPAVPAPAVTDQQARDAVAGVVALAAQRTPEAMQQLCRENDDCPGMSSSVDGAGASYVTQVLVDRDRDGALVVQEPAFWLGIRCTALPPGRAWDAIVQAPGQPEDHDAETRRACTGTDAWLAQVAAATDPGVRAASTG